MTDSGPHGAMSGRDTIRFKMWGRSLPLDMDRITRILSRSACALVEMPFPWLAALFLAIHVLISVWMVFVTQINDDGILYVLAARQFAQGHYAEAVNLYGWPTYSILIGTLSAITRLDSVFVAHTLNILASGLSALLIIAVLQARTGDRLVVVAAACLLLANYSFNAIRGAIVRDHLFMTFMILSYYCQVRDLAQPTWSNKLAFLAAGAAAALFRVEAVAFVVLVPLLRILFESRNLPLRILVLLALFVTVASVPLGFALWRGLDPVTEINHLLSPVISRMDVLRKELLAPFSMGKTNLAYSSIVIGLTVSGLVSGIGLLNIVLIAFGVRASREFRSSQFLYLSLMYVAVGSIVAAVQIYFTLLFDPPRHAGVLALITIFPASFALVLLYRRWSDPKQRPMTIAGVAALVAILMAYGFFGGLKFYDANRFVLDAAKWMKTQAPPTAHVLSNNNPLLFYGGFDKYDSEFTISIGYVPSIVGMRDWRRYDFIMLHLRRARLFIAAQLQRELGSPPIKTFENARGDQIVVFKPPK